MVILLVILVNCRAHQIHSRHSYEYQLCSPSRQLVPLLVRCRLHTVACQEKRIEAAIFFNLRFRYFIDDVLSLINSRFDDFVGRVYHIVLEIKDTTDTARSPSYLDIRLKTDNEGRLRTKFYDNRDDLNFPILKFPFICSNIPTAPVYGVYISQLIRYPRACCSYHDFPDRGF